MNEQNFVNFKRTRDLGAIISDTFKFLSVEWQPFFGTIIRISIVPILIAICAVVYYGMSSVSFLGDFSQAANNDDFNLNFSELFVPILAFVFAYIIAYALVTVSALSYIKSYISNKGLVNYDDIQATTKEKFWPYVGLFFLIAIMVGFGLLFCFIPGIYLGVVLSLTICLVIFQNQSVFDAVNDSFGFIKNHWWETFGILIVIQIIVGIISFILSLPASMYQGFDLASILQNQNPEELLNSFTDPIYLLLIGFSYFANFILYMVTTVSTVLIYFDIKEQKNPTSDIINEIGA